MWSCLAKTTRARWFSVAAVFGLLGAAADFAPGWQRAKTPARKTPAKTAPKKSSAKKTTPKKSAPKAAARPAGPTLAPASRKPNESELAALVRAFRENPNPARRAAIETYAAAHAKDTTGALARLGLGVALYEAKDFAGAALALAPAVSKLKTIADYAGYYLAAARVEMLEFDTVPKLLEAARGTDPRSPLAARSWVLEARARQSGKPAEAVRILRAHYAELPQPEGDLALADAYQAAQELPLAVEFYQRVYYGYIAGDAAARATAAVLAFEDSMGAAYPQPLPQQKLRRAERLMEARDYSRARAEYEMLAKTLTGGYREQAQVRAGASRMLEGNPSQGAAYLRGLDPEDPEAAAERLYYLAEAGRRLGDDRTMLDAVKRLDDYPESPWRLKALVTAANRFLLVNQADKFLPLYQAAADDFPRDPAAGVANWKVTFQAYLRGSDETEDRLREHLRRYPAHATTGAALYFLGRAAERTDDFSSARACYQRLAKTFQNHYYAMLARQRLALAPVASAPMTGEIARFVSELDLAQGNPVPGEAERSTTQRIERSRLLREAGLADLADGELRFGARTGGQPALLAMEMAEQADSPFRALRAMKSLAPEYLSLTFEEAPRRYWEYLFPLPYRFELESAARRQGVDPFLLAGLIRQESEFNPLAISSARAYGLTQVRPGTGREFARQAGVSGFSTSVLYQPAANLKIGAAILRSMLDRNEARIEQTLASYNAGPLRAAEWETWGNWREPAEFIESVPFTETRDYIQAVLRNADVYRRLYR